MGRRHYNAGASEETRARLSRHKVSPESWADTLERLLDEVQSEEGDG